MSRPNACIAAAALLVVLAAALPLAGCGTASDPLAATLTAPGQYDYYDCPAIKVAVTGIVKRQRELEGLMARAKSGPAGGFISASTYEPEYVTLRGKMNELRRVAAENHCDFVPGMAPAVELPPPAKKPMKQATRR